MNIQRQLLLLAIAIPLLLGIEATGIDEILEAYYFDAASGTFPWKNDATFTLLAHDGLRDLLLFVPLTIFLLWLVSLNKPHLLQSRLSHPWHQPRVLAYLFLAMLAGPLLVGLLKDTTTQPCPWNLIEFGGKLHYTHLWQGHFWRLSHPGKCFPGGHSSGGFALLAFLPLLAGQSSRRMLVTAMSLGLIMGWVQIMRGAHFLTHNLWSAWIVWLTIVLAWSLIRPHQEKQPGNLGTDQSRSTRLSQ